MRLSVDSVETFGCEETKPSYLGLVIRKGKSLLTLLLVPHALLDEVDKGLEKKPWIEGWKKRRREAVGRHTHSYNSLKRAELF